MSRFALEVDYGPMRQKTLLIGLLVYLATIALVAICAFRFTGHPWIWLLVAVVPFVT